MPDVPELIPNTTEEVGISFYLKKAIVLEVKRDGKGDNLSTTSTSCSFASDKSSLADNFAYQQEEVH